MFCYVLILFIYCIYDIRSASKMEGNIIGGEEVNIRTFPHSAGLKISCLNRLLKVHETWICGSSILNQKILMTAAHCFEGCEEMLPKSNRVIIDVTVGSTYLNNANYKGAKYRIHEDYDTQQIECDIALVYVEKSITLGDKVKRILIPKNIPRVKVGYVVGWGVTDEKTGKISQTLKSLKQEIMPRSYCQNFLKTPTGTICARLDTTGSHADRGDSGSGLIIKYVIAVGLVSHKHAKAGKTMTVYTDLHYYYKWIKKNAKELHCRRD